MRFKRWAGLAAALLLAATAAAEVLPPHMMAGGGGLGQRGSIRIHATVGQPFVGVFSGTYAVPDTTIQSGIGFWFLTVGRTASADSLSPVPAVTNLNRLEQNTPNPFNPATTIRFTLANGGRVRLRLFNVKGQKVADLLDQDLAAGEHALVFRPTELASGVYFYQLNAGSFQATRRLLLLK